MRAWFTGSDFPMVPMQCMDACSFEALTNYLLNRSSLDGIALTGLFFFSCDLQRAIYKIYIIIAVQQLSGCFVIGSDG